MNAQRHEWTFNYGAGTVAQAAAGKRDHHVERIEWWTVEKNDAERELRERGVDFRDREVTGGNRVEAVIDPELAARVNECRHKIAEHTRKVTEYEAFAEVLRANPTDTLKLAVDDVRFFGLA